MASATKLRMKSGYEIPCIGFGVYQIPEAQAEAVTASAILAGYRHVDSAVLYGNEAASVRGMLRAGVPREELYFTSKNPPKKNSYQDAKANVNATLEKTGLEYIDLYLLHAPFGGRSGRLGAWKALVEAVDEGKVRSIGVSNWGVKHLEELEQWQKEQPGGQAGILSINQVELHPWLTRPEIVEWCESRGVLLEAYSPLVQGTRMDDPLLQPLVTKYKKSSAQILLRWGLQKGFIVLPKTVSEARMVENLDVFTFELTIEEMRSLETQEYSPCGWDPTILPIVLERAHLSPLSVA